MRSSQVLSTLLAFAATTQAQSQSFAFTSTRRVSSIEDINVQPTATDTVSGPIETGQACALIGEAVSGSRLQIPSVEAEVSSSLYKVNAPAV